VDPLLRAMFEEAYDALQEVDRDGDVAARDLMTIVRACRRAVDKTRQPAPDMVVS
jgi:hypothetical protein